MSSSRFLIYQPDKAASFGQVPRHRRVTQAFGDVQEFVAACTIAQQASNIALTVYRATQFDDEVSANARVARAVAQFGVPHEEETTVGCAWPSGEPLKGGFVRWNGTPTAVKDLLAFVASGEPWPKQTLGPVELSYGYDFAWRGTPAAGSQLLDVAVPSSSLSVTLGRRSLIQPTFWFPYAPDDSGLQSFLRHIAPRLPFKLNSRHFRVAIPTLGHAGFRFAPLSQPILQAT